ncbi:hypothetical protein NC651_014648 [Populus alba x Populus x berolinensis]|nr:hypothetical protein NC651_014648 [Populus alba x Populus x berolinensis]
MSGLTEQRNGAQAAIVEENPRIFSTSFCHKQSLEPPLYWNAIVIRRDFGRNLGLQAAFLEVIVSRKRYIASRIENKIQIVPLSSSLANASDLGE